MKMKFLYAFMFCAALILVVGVKDTFAAESTATTVSKETVTVSNGQSSNDQGGKKGSGGGTVTPNYIPDPDGDDVSESFVLKMRQNALNIQYYSSIYQGDPLQAAYVGEYFAQQVKSGGPWDYKLQYGTSNVYTFLGKTVTGEDLGNIHYGYVGRAAGFSSTLLKSAAGAYQIYSGTANLGWYNSYFDDPRDQDMINWGISLWNSYGLGLSTSSR